MMVTADVLVSTGSSFPLAAASLAPLGAQLHVFLPPKENVAHSGMSPAQLRATGTFRGYFRSHNTVPFDLHGVPFVEYLPKLNAMLNSLDLIGRAPHAVARASFENWLDDAREAPASWIRSSSASSSRSPPAQTVHQDGHQQFAVNRLREGKGHRRAMHSTFPEHLLRPEDEVPSRRLFTVHLLTKGPVLDRYACSLESFVNKFYSRQFNHSVYLATPIEHARVVVDRLLPYINLQNLPQPGEALSWQHRSGVPFMLQPLRIEPPPEYSRNASESGTSASSRQARCIDRTWPLEYALYSGAFFVAQLLWQPLLGRADFYVKLDVDIDFTRVFPYDIGAVLAAVPAVHVAHTGLFSSSDCERGVLPELRAYRDQISRGQGEHVLPFQGRMSSWCYASRLPPMHGIVYGNFVAFRSAWMRSKHVQSLSRHLYYQASSGYFLSRWGDQVASPCCRLMQRPE